jgi:hypothetical protein
VSELARGGRRYQDLQDALDGISYKVLAETLRRTERDDLIARHLDAGRVERTTLCEHTGTGFAGRAADSTFVPTHPGMSTHFEVCHLWLKCRFARCIDGSVRSPRRCRAR